jgi:regulator of protease activity HflC (stomatin/prohibitin superfamily)
VNTTLLDAVVNNLAVLIPARMVHEYERGVLFAGGRVKRELPPGLHWFVPGWQSIEVLPVAPETRDLPTQSVMTKDGKSVTFSCNVCYRIVDPCRNYVAIQSFDESLIAFAMVHLAGSISSRTLAAIKRDREALEVELADTLSEKVAAWGAEIEWIGLTDLVETRAFRLYGGTFAA